VSSFEKGTRAPRRMDFCDDIIDRRCRLGPLGQRDPGRFGSLICYDDRFHAFSPCLDSCRGSCLAGPASVAARSLWLAAPRVAGGDHRHQGRCQGEPAVAEGNLGQREGAGQMASDECWKDGAAVGSR
jgi:hypothetical protein